MRIRKRTPARAALPGPTLLPPPPPPPPCLLLQPKGKPGVQGEEDEEKASLVVGGREEDLVLVASRNSLRSAMDKPKPQDAAAADVNRCSRNDGKRWRCKSAAVPGYVFCEQHIAWSTRKRKPRSKTSQSTIKAPTKEEPAAVEDGDDDDTAEEEEAKNRDDPAPAAANLRYNGDGSDDDDGFYYYGGFQPGSRKRAKSSGAAPE
ncbi:hypothetical protein GUJ93_ZPchr0012g20317 [Zizania palustris]|uniref:WRC domain-containing protein n=1 Tax=Zizania palustris TaxID=103762 RepID=A0A8J6BSA5_ZIZPA|nr:hypothetical protein GUJ93_ZPchr0012g20317 [Zizania palustris]